jgi:hypothetical protein
MAITYQWSVANMDRTLSNGFVGTVHYTISADDGTYASSAYGSLGLEAPEEEDAIPYAQLTPEIVIGWVKDKFGDEKVEEIEDALAAQIEQQRTPTTGAGVPWAS